MVEQIRKVRDLNRVDLMEAGGQELVNEAELRHWKGHAMGELLLEFAGSATKPDDTAKALSRMKTLQAATYKDCQQAKKMLADEKATVG
jgi:hypothetical protein